MAGGTTEIEKASATVSQGGPMAARFSALWTRARIDWASMQASQRRWTMASLALLGLLLGTLCWLGLRTDWRTLYAGLEPDDARQTGLVLTQAQIPFDVAANGTSILVPAPFLDKARLATAAKGVKSGRLGFELFDKPNWAGSEFDEQVNYQRALEGELERTVATLADIESARVHLALPHESLFRDDERPAKASVVLKMRRSSLADGEEDAIRNLVASAVDGLTPERVVLVDAAGHTPMGPKTQEALRLRAEQVLEEKLVSTLEPVTGTGNVRASVTLDYDEAATEQTDENYDPAQTATLSMQRTEQSSGGQPVAAGVPGAASNAPNAQALPVYPRQSTPPESSRSESGTYGVSKMVRHVVQNPGRVRRMTAAIVVNDHLLRAAAGKNDAQWQAWSPDQLRNLTLLAQAATGFDNARGDVLTVQDLAFDANRSPSPIPFTEKFMEATERSPVLIKYLALLLGLVVVVLLGLRPALKLSGQSTAVSRSSGKRSIPGELQQGAASKPLSAPSEPPPVDPERVRSQEIFEQVTGHLKRQPTQSSRLLQSWIHSDER
ncbi:MAG TPA: flagellar basal-body MS-ring/collar protein FliF [Terracidiphilus sp.]|jgi:flagellar M-ring protein FliF|nr:flagellar basal-body MS-ring/collar protein FliF [Terracidiphilus sp.]